MLNELLSQDLAVTLQAHGHIFTLVIVYLGGLALNLTPCVYPLIPVTISIFGGYSDDYTRRQRLGFSLLYVAGIAVTYSLLGLLAALTGKVLGSFLQNPLMLIAMGAFMIAMAMSQFGVFELRAPEFLTRVGNSGAKALQCLIMGLTVGIVAAPCLGPFVLGLLTYVSQQRNPMEGFTLFFTLAIGLGTPYVFLAYYSSVVSKLPRSGAWLLWVKKLFGFILIGMALYFVSPLMNQKLVNHLFTAIIAFTGIYLGLYELVFQRSKASLRVSGVVFTLICSGLAAWFAHTASKPLEHPRWQYGNFEHLAAAVATGKPVIADVYADWCIPCKELDHLVFSDAKVIALSEKFTMIKIDMTSADDPALEAGAETYKIMGMPSILFFNASKEQSKLRIVSLVNVEEMLATMKKALQ